MPISVPSGTPEFQPLLPAGLHTVTVQQLRQMCVDGFPLSVTRSVIMRSLEQVVERLNRSSVVGHIWANGSFVTKKMDPGDVDIVLRIQAHLYENGAPAQREAIDWVKGNLKLTHRCDSYLLMEYPPGHVDYWIGEYVHAFWMRQWGFSRGLEMKGIAVITLP